jgi:DNA-binding beta-propeller fold protein YncE
MKSSSIIRSTLLLGAMALLAGCAESGETASAQEGAMAMGPMGNNITGEGLPNPTSTMTTSWGQLPAGRELGSSAGADIDPTDGHVWYYERCGSGSAGGPGVNCDSNPVPPVFKLDRNTGEVLANIGEGVMVSPHGIHVDEEGNVWVTDFSQNEARTKGHQVHKFSPDGELLMSLGTAGQAGSGPNQFNQPTDVIVAPDGSIFVSDGHSGQGQTSQAAVDTARAQGLTSRIIHLTADGTSVLHEWGQIGGLHGEFRTPHALEFDAQGRLWIADRGNHRLEIYDQSGNYLESRYQHGRISGIFITEDQMVYTIDSESGPYNHTNWSNGVRIGPVDQDIIVAFIPPHAAPDTRPLQGAAGEGVAVDEDGNVFAAEGPNSLSYAGGPFTKYSVGGM